MPGRAHRASRSRSRTARRTGREGVREPEERCPRRHGSRVRVPAQEDPSWRHGVKAEEAEVARQAGRGERHSLAYRERRAVGRRALARRIVVVPDRLYGRGGLLSGDAMVGGEEVGDAARAAVVEERSGAEEAGEAADDEVEAGDCGAVLGDGRERARSR